MRRHEDRVQVWLERVMMPILAFLAFTEWKWWLATLLWWGFFTLLIRELKRH